MSHSPSSPGGHSSGSRGGRGASVDGHGAGHRKPKLHENFLFLGKFFRHGTKIASVWPSSPVLARATIKQIDWDSVKVVVELGAGTGPITDQIIRRLKPQTT